MNSPFAIGKASTCLPIEKFGDPYILLATSPIKNKIEMRVKKSTQQQNFNHKLDCLPSCLFFQSRIFGTPYRSLLRTFTQIHHYSLAQLYQNKKGQKEPLRGFLTLDLGSMYLMMLVEDLLVMQLVVYFLLL